MNRQQCTEVAKIAITSSILTKNIFRSQFRINNPGVPQESNVGLILFLISVNDLPLATPHRCNLFAYDTTLIVEGNKSTYENSLNKALTNIDNWTSNNNLNINLTKMAFSFS